MGGGVCPINFCGTLQTANALRRQRRYGQSGADSICNSGRVCVVGPPVPPGNAFQLDLRRADAGALAFGAACSTSRPRGCAARTTRSASPRPISPASRSAARCAATTPTARASSSCLEYPTATAPDGSTAKVGYCTPSSKIAATSCARESDCPPGAGVRLRRDADLADRLQGDAAAPRRSGQACASTADCLQRRLLRPQVHAQRRQQPDLLLVGLRGQQRLRPGSDVRAAGPEQQRHAVRPDRRRGGRRVPDAVHPVGASGCGIDSDCVGLANGSDTCDATHGLCYNKSAVPGLGLHGGHRLHAGRRLLDRRARSPAATARPSAARRTPRRARRASTAAPAPAASASSAARPTLRSTPATTAASSGRTPAP